eukprot:CAMPEP_0196743930 /NCGR_PEP_ID=MMETSP1091-20130531/55156_1 /TAXON_ID=302021 /ORGANISM="Rhodomonas sp., Strain CCMP768" /LENGTH=191 /DNA_ID=CAMNT_0042090385 /DNA_START=8 /DNA_END=583 /DNA_ORIENTATION=+
MRKAGATSSSAKDTVRYPPTAQRAAPTTLGSRISTAPSTLRPQQNSKMVVGDRGQALVPPSRVGPIRHQESKAAPMGSNRDFKTSFKTPGTTEKHKSNPVVDFAQTKNRKGRFEELNVSQPSDAAHFSYGAVSGAQFGRAERPASANKMLGFRNVCRPDMPTPPSTTVRDLDKPFEVRQHHLDNVLARAGI